jgi:hypothetical protein
MDTQFSDSNRYSERTTPNKNARFRPKDAPLGPTRFGRGGLLICARSPSGKNGIFRAVLLEWAQCVQ